jgi:hypothetical protein
LTAEELIVAAFSGDSPLHRSVRVSLLRVLHAGEQCQWSLDALETDLHLVLDEPAFHLWAGVFGEDCSIAATRLETLATELRKSGRALTAAHAELQRNPPVPQESANERVRQQLNDSTPTADADPPF